MFTLHQLIRPDIKLHLKQSQHVVEVVVERLGVGLVIEVVEVFGGVRLRFVESGMDG